MVAGLYVIEAEHRITKRLSPTDPDLVETMVTIVEYDVQVRPCAISEITSPVSIAPVTYTILEAGF